MKTFKTPKGTELPLLNLKGKDYLQAQHRVLWFREEKPEWGIETEIISHSPDHTLARATIRNEAGRIMAQATKEETRQGFPDHCEKAETGSIARALALCGYGTQFAQEFEEGERLADSPSPPINSTPRAIQEPQMQTTSAAPKHSCGNQMMLSKYPNKVTGNIDWYCAKCKASVERATAERS